MECYQGREVNNCETSTERCLCKPKFNVYSGYLQKISLLLKVGRHVLKKLYKSSKFQ